LQLAAVCPALCVFAHKKPVGEMEIERNGKGERDKDPLYHIFLPHKKREREREREREGERERERLSRSNRKGSSRHRR
jgi:hypothetical protein